MPTLPGHGLDPIPEVMRKGLTVITSATQIISGHDGLQWPVILCYILTSQLSRIQTLHFS